MALPVFIGNKHRHCAYTCAIVTGHLQRCNMYSCSTMPLTQLHNDCRAFCGYILQQPVRPISSLLPFVLVSSEEHQIAPLCPI